VDNADPLAYAAATGSSNPDTLMHHKAMRAPDWETFLGRTGDVGSNSKVASHSGKKVLDGT
jgi:hypothetical protein